MTVNERILKIIELTKLNKRQFSNEIGVQPQTLHHIISGRLTKPGYEIIEKILSTFSYISADWLITGKGEMIKKNDKTSNLTETKENSFGGAIGGAIGGASPQIPSDQITGSAIEIRKLVVAVDEQDRELIKFVPGSAFAGYLTGFGDPEYVEQLPFVSISGWLPSGSYRGFEVKGDSMEDTYKPADKLICRYVQNWQHLRTRECYVLVTNSDIVVKRIEVISDGVRCHSDNGYYPPYELGWAEIREIWKVEAYIRIGSQAPNRYHALADEITELKRKLNDK